ncbi:MAG: hypothetical protein BM485_02710 [Desulfobulbaceae bacterium DB1]|nr:MAG: hypothetical protein BM485_02710 [Desulfobulbaceae bacterium DB1]
MGCCRKLFLSGNDGSRSVLCKRHVPILRVATVVSIWVDVACALLLGDGLVLTVKLFMVIHLVLAAFILFECRRSDSYHRLYAVADKKY